MAYGKQQIKKALKGVSRTKRGASVEKLTKELPGHKMSSLETKKALQGMGVSKEGTKQAIQELASEPEMPAKEEKVSTGRPEETGAKKPGKVETPGWMKEVGSLPDEQRPDKSMGQAIEEDVRIEEAQQARRPQAQPSGRKAQAQSDVDTVPENAKKAHAEGLQRDQGRIKESERFADLDKQLEQDEAEVDKLLSDQSGTK